MDKISVVITAYNNHKLTTVHVRECMNSTLVPDEIIVVNDHGTPDLKEMIEKLEMKTKVIYAYIVEDIPWNYTGARNLGVWLSSGDYIVSEDNDNIPSRTLYEDMYKFLKENPDYDSVLAGFRPKILLEDALTKPMEEWQPKGRGAPHDDSFMMRREFYLRMKGYDEQFAGAYAWACTDWRRRRGRANSKFFRIKTPYFTVPKGETKVCMCKKSTEERSKTAYCKDCGLLFKRQSYRNYGLARKKTHIQSPKGILNFSYNFTIYDKSNK